MVMAGGDIFGEKSHYHLSNPVFCWFCRDGLSNSETLPGALKTIFFTGIYIRKVQLHINGFLTICYRWKTTGVERSMILKMLSKV
jgi:hypothetical protein